MWIKDKNEWSSARWNLENLSEEQIEKLEDELDDKVSGEDPAVLAKKLGISDKAAEYLRQILHR